MVEIHDSLGAESFKEQFAGSPQLLSFLEANFSGPVNAKARELLLTSSDESTFPLRQWVEGLRTMRAWLDARGLEMPVEDEIGYVCCVGEAAGAGANLTLLPALVSEMLEAYGCERATKKGRRRAADMGGRSFAEPPCRRANES